MIINYKVKRQVQRLSLIRRGQAARVLPPQGTMFIHGEAMKLCSRKIYFVIVTSSGRYTSRQLFFYTTLGCYSS